MPAFEWFDSRTETPGVALTEDGLAFNRAAVDLLPDVGRVVLGFDREQRLIALRPLGVGMTDEEHRGFAFAGRRRGGMVRLRSREFVRYVGAHCPDLEPGSRVRYAAWWDKAMGLLIVDLKRPLGRPAPGSGVGALRRRTG